MTNRYFTFLFIFMLISLSHPVFALRKKQIDHLIEMHHAHRFTFFCQQPFELTGKLTATRCKTCPPYPPAIEWMPIIPLSTLASSLPCYREKKCRDKKGKEYKGLRCCQKIDPLYLRMSTDLHNFVPEHPTLIRARKNYSFDEWLIEGSPPSGCHFYLDKKNKRLFPDPVVRGAIARTYLYFHQQYAFPLTDKEKSLFQRWDREFPLSEWEQKRNLFLSHL